MSASGGREQEKGTTKGREMIAWPVAHSTAPVVQAATAAQPTEMGMGMLMRAGRRR